MRLIQNMLVAAIFSLSLASVVKADPFVPIITNYRLTGTNPTQLGRPSRNSIPQDWSHTESYPGAINTTSTYYYQALSFTASNFTGAPYLDISTYDPTNGASYFISAYANSYDASHPSANWLGDAGFSGNYITDDGGDFQVILPTNADLVVVLNSTGTNAALPTYSFQFAVTAFGDALGDDPIAVTPEPSSLILAGTGLLGMVGGFVRKRMA